MTAAGWNRIGNRDAVPRKRFEAWGILRVLNNPRYAGLSPWKGEILCKAEWPAYVSPHQFATLRDRRTRTRSTSIGPRPKQPFLLVGIGCCGGCHCPIHAITGVPRQDGSQLRRYLCSGTSESTAVLCGLMPSRLTLSSFSASRASCATGRRQPPQSVLLLRLRMTRVSSSSSVGSPARSRPMTSQQLARYSTSCEITRDPC